MVDIPPVLPPAYAKVLTRELLKCGLRNGGFSVKYEEEFQSVVIVIEKVAGASTGHLDCIKQAAGTGIVTFSDPKTQQLYDDRLFEVLRPRLLADARADLQKRGILHRFPKRSNFDSDIMFAEALEKRCGMKPGSFFVQGQWGLVGKPTWEPHSKSDLNKMSCLVAAMTYVHLSGEGVKFGFIGNEALAHGK